MARPAKRRCVELPRPLASSETARKRMQSTLQRDTTAELRIRKLLHAMGLRYSVDAKPLEDSPRRADVVFRRAKVAVLVDGCFWHGCPEHGTWPRANEQFWRAKILANIERDADTNDRLRDHGWLVIRVWEHEDPSAAATRIARRVHSRLSMPPKPRNSIR
ncbi:MAG: very short patch repair endonuclease [Anaerolineae bacterium]|nr:very short patch repair endonuclease [Anaerolineae bacterium]